MKKRKKKFSKQSLLLILLFCSLMVMGQESINTAGKEISSSSGTISYSVGQVVSDTHSTTAGTINEGVQQPSEMILSTIETIEASYNWITTYPNPTNEKITLEIRKEKLDKFRFQLYDIKGNVLENKAIKNKQTKIMMNNLLSGTYLLKVIQNNQKIVTFKIIKK